MLSKQRDERLIDSFFLSSSAPRTPLVHLCPRQFCLRVHAQPRHGDPEAPASVQSCARRPSRPTPPAAVKTTRTPTEAPTRRPSHRWRVSNSLSHRCTGPTKLTRSGAPARLGGMCGSIVTAPFDVVKTRLQSDLFQQRVAGPAKASSRTGIRALLYNFVDTAVILR